VFVEGLPPRTCYTWRRTAAGHGGHRRRFVPSKELVDPRARAVTDAVWTAAGLPIRGRRARVVPRGGHGTAAAPRERAAPRGLEGAIVYELHVAASRAILERREAPGTFAGLVEKIPYLRELGVTHVELLPVMAFDEQDVPAGAAARASATTGATAPTASSARTHVLQRRGAWPPRVPRARRCPARGGHRGAARRRVQPHGGGGADGPVINFKGLANDSFYHLDPGDRRRYRDYTGCGNTVNCNHPR